MNESFNLEILKEKLSGKRALITGGMGMLGSAVAHQLVKYNAEVTIVDSFIYPFGANYFNIENIRDRIDIVTADIRDTDKLKILVKEKDLIFNFAGQVCHNDSIDEPLLDADINYLGQLNVMENVRKYNRGAKMLFSGSRLQFGNILRNPVNEEHPLNPKTPYAFHKTVTEHMYRYYYEVHDIDTVVFRISNPYGIRCQMKHSKYSIVNYFIRQAIENEIIKVFGEGNQLRDYIFVEDLASAFVLAAVNEKANGEVFNVGSGIGTRFKDMVNLVVKIVAKGKIEYIPWPDHYLNVETGDYVTDISKISGMIGWVPSVSVEEGIEKTFLFYKKNGKHYF